MGNDYNDSIFDQVCAVSLSQLRDLFMLLNMGTACAYCSVQVVYFILFMLYTEFARQKLAPTVQEATLINAMVTKIAT